jgi:hypothetical protein
VPDQSVGSSVSRKRMSVLAVLPATIHDSEPTVAESARSNGVPHSSIARTVQPNAPDSVVVPVTWPVALIVRPVGNAPCPMLVAAVCPG